MTEIFGGKTGCGESGVRIVEKSRFREVEKSGFREAEKSVVREVEKSGFWVSWKSRFRTAEKSGSNVIKLFTHKSYECLYKLECM